MSSVNIEYLIETALIDGELTFANAHDEDRFQAWRLRATRCADHDLAGSRVGDGHGSAVSVTTHAGGPANALCRIPLGPRRIR